MTYEIIIGRSKEDIDRYGKLGTILLAKQYVKMGETTSLANEVYMDIASAHVVFVCGKRGCLTGDTMVFTDKGYKQIKEFNQKEDKVLSFNKAKKEFDWENAELLEYPLTKENILEIGFTDGRIIRLTKEHPLLMNYGKYIFWRPAQELKINDKIILSTFLPEIKKDVESLKMARILGFVLSDGTINKRKGKWKDGKGYWYNGTKSRLRIFCDDKDVLETAKKDIEEEFGLYVKQYNRNDCNCSVVQSLHSKVIDKIHNLGVPLGNKAGIIRIPEAVWRHSNEFKANFISALFSCDGFIEKNGRTIDYSSKSRKFLEDLQILLTHFEIESVIRIKNSKCLGRIYPNYRLFITDNRSIENFKTIGFISKFKQDRLEKHKANNTKRRSTFYYSNGLVSRKIASIKEVNNIGKVYDLSVDKNHSFIANGIISHNSGKSYTMGVIAEGLASMPIEVRNNLSILMLDTMGVYWTMKYPNRQDAEELRNWNIEPKPLDVIIFTPVGYYYKYKEEGVPTDFPFSIKPSELSIEDWCMSFDIDRNSDVGVLIERVINNLILKKKEYSIEDIINAIREDLKSSDNIKNAAENRFLNTETWGLLSEQGVALSDLVKPGKVTVLDVSCYATVPGGWTIKALVIGLVSQKLFMDRMSQRKTEEFADIERSIHFFTEKKEQTMPLVWIVVDEAQEFLPNKGKTTATNALITILREGRQPGISLILASQQPGKIHSDVMTQSDIVISHRLTAKIDTDALGVLMQSYMREGLDRQLDNLPSAKGSALIIDDNNERLYPVLVRPRFTWHGGGSPIAIKEKAKEFEF